MPVGPLGLQVIGKTTDHQQILPFLQIHTQRSDQGLQQLPAFRLQERGTG